MVVPNARPNTKRMMPNIEEKKVLKMPRTKPAQYRNSLKGNNTSFKSMVTPW